MTDNPIPPRVPPRRPPQMPTPAANPSKSPVGATAAKPATVGSSLKPLAEATTPKPPITPTTTLQPSPTPDAGDSIVAKGSTEYRIRRYLMTLLLVAGGIWFAYDGWKGWPAENQQIHDLNSQLEAARKAGNNEEVDRLNLISVAHKTPHTDLDIRAQKYLAFGLPIGGLLFLMWTLHNSRGEYRLRGNTLSVPGHPPVDLSEITEVDRSKWDRKGIAFIHYTKTNGVKGKLRLDDFVYQQNPTDEIFKRLESFVTPSQTP